MHSENVGWSSKLEVLSILEWPVGLMVTERPGGGRMFCMHVLVKAEFPIMGSHPILGEGRKKRNHCMLSKHHCYWKAVHPVDEVPTENKSGPRSDPRGTPFAQVKMCRTWPWGFDLNQDAERSENEYLLIHRVEGSRRVEQVESWNIVFTDRGKCFSVHQENSVSGLQQLNQNCTPLHLRALKELRRIFDFLENRNSRPHA